MATPLLLFFSPNYLFFLCYRKENISSQQQKWTKEHRTIKSLCNYEVGVLMHENWIIYCTIVHLLLLNQSSHCAGSLLFFYYTWWIINWYFKCFFKNSKDSPPSVIHIYLQNHFWIIIVVYFYQPRYSQGVPIVLKYYRGFWVHFCFIFQVKRKRQTKSYSRQQLLVVQYVRLT